MTQHIEITRIFDAPRELVYRAFTDPGQLAQWFGPAGCPVPRDSIEIDARPGGHLRFVMTAPDVRSPVDATFTDVVENELLAGEMEAAGVPGVAGPLRVHLRLEFHDEGNGKTRLELRPVRHRAARRGHAQRMGKLVHQAGRAAESVPGTGSWNSEAVMAKLIYSAIASADGYIEDPGGSIDWGMPDEELPGFINELEQPRAPCTLPVRSHRCRVRGHGSNRPSSPALSGS